MRCIICKHRIKEASHIALVQEELETLCDECYYKAAPFFEERRRKSAHTESRGSHEGSEQKVQVSGMPEGS